MKQNAHSLMFVVALATLAASASTQAGPGEWVQIPLDGPIEYELPDGSTRMLDPSCSNGPMQTADGIQPADPQFSFLMQIGDPRKLVIALDGGGACWDAPTCLGSPLLGASLYSQTVDETPADAAQVGGIFDADNPDNPYLDYTKVFIPYCSADVHWGSRDTLYTLRRPGQPDLDWVIRHRGTENFLAVLHWLRTEGPLDGLDLGDVHDLTLGGASAGAYGATAAFPYVAELVPNARLRLIADAGIGVINETFYKQALYDPGSPDAASWGVVNSLPTFMGLDEGFLAMYAEQPLFLLPGWFAELSRYRPRARLAMVTSNLDSVQVGFYALMELLAGRQGNLALIPLEWYAKMQLITNATETLPNYRSFVEAGTYHTIVADDRYYQAGESGVVFRDWNQAMINGSPGSWVTVDVGAPF